MIRQAPWAIVLGLTLAMTVGGCDSGSPEVKPSACPIPVTPPTGTHSPAGQAPGGGGVEVVDHGFTQFFGLENGGNVSLGALVRNTSDQIAYRTQVTMRIKDVQGRDAVHPVSAKGLILEIPVIRPGEQVAVAARAGVRDDVDSYQTPDKVTRFDVEFGTATWLPAEDAAMFPSFTTAFQSLERTESDSLIWYSATSTACRAMVSRGAVAVFLNSSGRVVGGLFGVGGISEQCGTAGYQGRVLDIIPVPNGIDEAKTLVSEYCDVARPESGVYRPSGVPVN